MNKQRFLGVVLFLFFHEVHAQDVGRIECEKIESIRYIALQVASADSTCALIVSERRQQELNWSTYWSATDGFCKLKVDFVGYHDGTLRRCLSTSRVGKVENGTITYAQCLTCGY